MARVGADLCVCPEPVVEDATDRELPNGGDLGEPIGSPLRDRDNGPRVGADPRVCPEIATQNIRDFKNAELLFPDLQILTPADLLNR